MNPPGAGAARADSFATVAAAPGGGGGGGFSSCDSQSCPPPRLRNRCAPRIRCMGPPRLLTRTARAARSELLSARPD